MTRPWNHQVAPLIRVTELPEQSTIEARCSEYADAIEVRGVEESTGTKSPWRTVSVWDGRAEVAWHQLWAAPEGEPAAPRHPTIPIRRSSPFSSSGSRVLSTGRRSR